MPFPEAVRALLQEKEVSLKELARRAGVTPGYVRQVLRGVRPPSDELVRRVRDALSVPVGYFPEEREAVVIERVRNDPSFRDEAYRRVRRRAGR